MESLPLLQKRAAHRISKSSLLPSLFPLWLRLRKRKVVSYALWPLPAALSPDTPLPGIYHSLSQFRPWLDPPGTQSLLRRKGKGKVGSVSHVQLFARPWTAAHQTSLSITNSQGLLKLMPIESVNLSNCLILCHPLLLLPSIFSSIRVFSNEWASHQVAKILMPQP